MKFFSSTSIYCLRRSNQFHVAKKLIMSVHGFIISFFLYLQTTRIYLSTSTPNSSLTRTTPPLLFSFHNPLHSHQTFISLALIFRHKIENGTNPPISRKYTYISALALSIFRVHFFDFSKCPGRKSYSL